MADEMFPARLHVLVARESSQAIVIRRGPSKLTCVLGWDRKTNTVEVAQWLKGRIYERRCDISPNGKHWIYFAMNGKWDSTVKGAWSAVAKSPWLKAVCLHAKGDCWNGGGLFLDNNKYWLNDGHGHESLKTCRNLSRDESYEPPEFYGGECLTGYYNRLQRDGWTFTGRGGNGQWDTKSIFEKVLSRKWLLRKICHEQVGSPKGKGCYWDEHELQNDAGEVLTMPDWEWAEWLDGAIVYAKNGSLYEMKINTMAFLGEQIHLHDFNGYEFENRTAPY